MHQYTTANSEKDRDMEEALMDCRFQRPSILLTLTGPPPRITVFKASEITRRDILPSEADNE